MKIKSCTLKSVTVSCLCPSPDVSKYRFVQRHTKFMKTTVIMENATIQIYPKRLEVIAASLPIAREVIGELTDTESALTNSFYIGELDGAVDLHDLFERHTDSEFSRGPCKFLKTRVDGMLLVLFASGRFQIIGKGDESGVLSFLRDHV
jgi:hypothetical protein